MVGQVLFINGRPTIEIDFCQFIRKYVSLHISIPLPQEHIASFYFDEKLVHLGCKNFLIDETLVWPQKIWFQKASKFISEFRKNNYKHLECFAFPVPHFELQKQTNEITLMLLLLDRLSFLDAMSPETFQIILNDIVKTITDENIFDLLLQISTCGAHRSLSNVYKFFNENFLTRNLKANIEKQQVCAQKDLNQILLEICNKKSIDNHIYKALNSTSDSAIVFLNKPFRSFSLFEQYWKDLKLNNNVIILNDSQSILKLQFSNKNCRVQKTRCWVFKQIPRTDIFETKMAANILILLLTSFDKITAFEIGQNQKINIIGKDFLKKAEQIYEFRQPTIVFNNGLNILLSSEFSLQDSWLLFEMQIMSFYQKQQKNTVFADFSTKQVGPPLNQVCNIFNWHVMVVYLIWYLVSYSKNFYLHYAWQPFLKDQNLSLLYKDVFHKKSDAIQYIHALQGSSFCWFSNKKIKINSPTNYFGPFQTLEFTVSRKKHLEDKKTSRQSSLTRQALYCFSNDEFIQPQKQRKNVSVISWNEEFDFSKEDFTVWFDEEIFAGL